MVFDPTVLTAPAATLIQVTVGSCKQEMISNMGWARNVFDYMHSTHELYIRILENY